MSKLPRALFLAVLTGLAVACATIDQAAPGLKRGAVAAPEFQAAQVGGEILRRGGNAVDAAIAVQFAPRC